MSSDGMSTPGWDPGGSVGRTPEPPPSSGHRPRVGMALYGDLTYDSRVRKEARTLTEAGYEVVITCLASQAASPDLPASVMVLIVRPFGPSIIPGSPNPFATAHAGHVAGFRRRVAWLVAYVRGLREWGRLVVEAAGPVDVWHAHDLTGLAAIIPNLPSRFPIVYDSHELFLETGTALRLPGLARSLLRAYERRAVSRTSAVITVNDEIASVLRRRYRPTRIEVVHNCPYRWSPPPIGVPLLREAADIPVGEPIVLYHGGLTAGRGVELLMQAMDVEGLEDVHLILMGYGERSDEFRRLARSDRGSQRIHVLDPVPPSDLLPWVASADVGAMPNPGMTRNDYFSSPNKLFECLAAGIPVIASDVPTMRRIIIDDPDGPLGALCDPTSTASIAAAMWSIVRLNPSDKGALRARCLRAADERWNWEREGETLLSVYSEVIPRRR